MQTKAVKEDITTETQSTQSSEYFFLKTFTLRPPRLRGAISEPAPQKCRKTQK